MRTRWLLRLVAFSCRRPLEKWYAVGLFGPNFSVLAEGRCLLDIVFHMHALNAPYLDVVPDSKYSAGDDLSSVVSCS